MTACYPNFQCSVSIYSVTTFLRLTWALFSSPQKVKIFQDSPSQQILEHMHEALDIDKNKN